MSNNNFSFRNIAFQENNGSFTGVCLDLDIIEEDHASLEEAILSINDAVVSHFKVISKLKYPKELLNRPAPKEYWDKLKEITTEKSLKRNFSPFQFFTTTNPLLSYA